MLQKFYARLFTIIFLPLVACQLPREQSAQPAEQPTAVPTALPTPEPLPVTGIPLCEPLLATEHESRYTSGLVNGDYVSSYGQQWPSDNSEIVILNQPEDVINLKPYIAEETFTLLTNTDFSTYFVVLAFEGGRKNLVNVDFDFRFCISQWSHSGKDVTLSLQLLQQYIVPDVLHYHYFYFQVTRDETWKGDFTFKLNQTRYTHSTIYHDGVVGETKFTFQ